MKIKLLGIDLAKNVFQICALNQANKVLFNRLLYTFECSRFIQGVAGQLNQVHKLIPAQRLSRKWCPFSDFFTFDVYHFDKGFRYRFYRHLW